MRVFVVIPAYEAERTIRKVLEEIPEYICGIIVVDDGSRDRTQQVVREEMSRDPRIRLIMHELNQGVGGAVLTGYGEALNSGADIVIKMDSDGQMNPAFLPKLIAPIMLDKADYAKGNRFLNNKAIRQMPFVRRLGNLGLSFLTKLASGYWSIFDPTNGYTAVRASVLPQLNSNRINRRYFFESSLLLELALVRAVVCDVNIPASYGSEKSLLSEFRAFFEFPPRLFVGMVRRILSLYFVQDFTATSLFILCGITGVVFGLTWGIYHWVRAASAGVVETTGTVMIAVLPIIVGIQMLLQAVVLDIQNTPCSPISLPDDEAAAALKTLEQTAANDGPK